MAVHTARIWEALTPLQISGLNGLSLNTHSVNGAGAIPIPVVKDLEGSQLSPGASALEALAASDTVSSTLVALGIINEVVNAADLIDGILINDRVVTEPVVADDLETATAVFVADILEPLAVSDSANQRADYAASINEVVGAADASDATTVQVGLIVEAVNAGDLQFAVKDGEVEQPAGGSTANQRLRFRGIREGTVRVPIGQDAYAHAGELYTAGDAVAYVQGQCARAAAPPECRLPYKNVACPLQGQAAHVEAGTFKAHVFHPAQHAVAQLMTGAVGHVYCGTLCPQGVKNPTDDDLAWLVLSIARRRRAA